MAHTPSCPRCGYDLSGAVASWTDTCPLKTTCSECGLLFELRLVLNERLRGEVEFFEVTIRPTFGRLFKTARRAIRPWRFWSWVAMEHPPRHGRMAVGVLVSMVLIEIPCALLAAILIVVPWLIGDNAGGRSQYIGYAADRATEQVQTYLTPWAADPQYDWSYGFDGSSMTPGGVLILPLLVQLLMPATFILLPQTLRKSRVLPRHFVRIAAWSFVALPLLLSVQSLFRLTIDAVGWGWSLVGMADSDVFDWASEAWVHTHWWLLLTILTGWTFAWYGWALGRYLKLPTPWLITLAMFSIAFLLSFLICLLLPGIWYDIVLHVWK
jgi:hypothetical protein